MQFVTFLIAFHAFIALCTFALWANETLALAGVY